MSGEGGLATGLRMGGNGLPCQVPALVHVLTLGSDKAGFVFFFVFLL